MSNRPKHHHGEMLDLIIEVNSRANKPPAFLFYVTDWMGSVTVRTMTAEQRGWYVDLMCLCWDSPDLSLPADDETLARLCGAGDRWAKHGAIVRSCLSPHPRVKGALTIIKLVEVRHLQLQRALVGSEGGKASAKQRAKQNPSNDSGEKQPSQDSQDSQGSSSQESQGSQESRVASSTADARAVMTWFYGLWSKANDGAKFPFSSEPFPKAEKAAKRLLKDRPEGQSLEAFLASLEPAALSALRGEFKSATPRTLAAYVAARGGYTERNRFGGGKRPGRKVDLGVFAPKGRQS